MLGILVEVLSLFQAFLGQYPQSRHDGTPWTKADGKRKRLAGAIGCRSALIRITGDWKMWKEIFKFPQWNETAGCCFRCAVTPGGLKDTGLSAPWRRKRLSHWDNIIRLRANALPVAPLFGLLHFDIAKICRLDWLHAADQGVAADYIGQLYKSSCPALVEGTPASDWMSCGKTSNLATSATRRNPNWTPSPRRCSAPVLAFRN